MTGRAITNPTRQDTWNVTVHILDTNTWIGLWEKKTGGDSDSNELTYMPGGMAPRISLGGQQIPTNITLQREYDGNQDNGYITTLLKGVGRMKIAVVQRALDFNGQPYGKRITWQGILKRVKMPDVDSEGNAAALLEIEVTCGAAPSATSA
jgi:hypothetical protein